VDNYILIGIPDSGKSTLGRRAAEALGMGFYDTDVFTRERASARRRLLPMSIAFAEVLVEEETKVMEELTQTANRLIIATGADVALRTRTVNIIKNLGTLIYIKRDPDLIIADIRENKRHSWIMENMETHEVINLRELAVTEYAKCRSDYEAIADITLENNGGEDAGLEQLVTIIKKTEQTRWKDKDVFRANRNGELE
jgi:shikimate kinase